MRAVVQRVSRAKVTVRDEITGEIGHGLLVLLGVGTGDTRGRRRLPRREDHWAAYFRRCGRQNEFADRGCWWCALVVSQFTLYGDVRRGKRPSFERAAHPQLARELYEYFVGKVRAAGLRCETGRFQETMQVELVNEGPVTILLDSNHGRTP